MENEPKKFIGVARVSLYNHDNDGHTTIKEEVLEGVVWFSVVPDAFLAFTVNEGEQTKLVVYALHNVERFTLTADNPNLPHHEPAPPDAFRRLFGE